jgi:hypothetical protein
VGDSSGLYLFHGEAMNANYERNALLLSFAFLLVTALVCGVAYWWVTR